MGEKNSRYRKADGRGRRVQELGSSGVEKFKGSRVQENRERVTLSARRTQSTLRGWDTLRDSG
jgi:hypothetical protein